MTKLAPQQLEWLVSAGYTVSLSLNKDAKGMPFTCATNANFGENDSRGVWSYGHHGDTLDDSISAAYIEARRQA